MSRIAGCWLVAFLTRSRNERPETKAWAKKLLEVIEGEPVYHHYDELYRTS